ncbi:MAG: amidohydrolase family protein [Gemmatimonadaceae bacterium]
MQATARIAALLVLLVGLGTQPVAAQGAAPIVISNVTVIDVETGERRPGVSVVVTGNRITNVGRLTASQLPRGARTVDGSGKFLIPGLWDFHVHSAYPGLLSMMSPLYVANGVTGVREMFGAMPAVRAWRDSVAQGTLAGPRIVAAGHILDGPTPIWPGSASAKTPDDARRLVDSLKSAGADSIKVYSLLPRDVYLAIAEHAKAKNISFQGHVPEAVNVREASNAGQKTMEHLTGFPIACSSREDEFRAARANALGDMQAWRRIAAQQAVAIRDSYDPQRCAELFALLKKNMSWQVPTLTVNRNMAYLDDASLGADPRLKYIPKFLSGGWDPKTDFRLKDRTPAQWQGAKKAYDLQVRMTSEMYKAGVPMLAGTDVLNPYCLPGFSLHDELEYLVKAGVTPLDAIRMATLNPARVLGAADSLGTVAANKIADLVLLDADPLANIRNTTRINAVVANGRLYDRAALEALLSAAEKFAASTATPR